MQNFLRLISQKKISILVLVVSDLIFFLLSFFAAYYLRNFIGAEIQELSVYLFALPVAFFIMVVVFYFFGLYEQKIRLESTSEIFTVIKAILLTAVLLMAGSFLYKYDYSRGFVIILIGFGLVFLNIGRYLIRIWQKYLVSKGRGLNRILIIGAGKPGRRLAKQIEKYKDFGYQIIGFLDDNVKKGKVELLGTVRRLATVIKDKKIDIVFVSDPTMPHEKMLELMTECGNLNVKFKLVSSLYEILAGNIDISEIEGIPSIDVKPRKSNIFYRIVKRFLDIVLSIIGLIIALPFWLLIVVLIRLNSKGAAHFVHTRVGKDGRKFKLYKFRTMKKSVGSYETAPLKPNDKRITGIGRFLRKTSLDELPQLINVLKGEMSLVGPRPEMPFIVEKYSKWQRKRLEVRPGLTGLWQILGRKDLPLHENIEYDFYYIQNQSLLLDLVILIKTVWAVIAGKGAF
jgi:exopolysaccharide biosynthesis polyprenyl glycosylphosphotransferase